jgi:hypothetical protein
MAILDPKNLLDLRNWCLEKIVRPFWRFAADCCCVRQEPQVFCASDRIWFISRDGKIGHMEYDSDKLCVVFKAKGQVVSHQESGNYMFFRIANRTSKGWETANPKRGVLFYKGKLVYNGLTQGIHTCTDTSRLLLRIDNDKGLIFTSGKILNTDGKETDSCEPIEGFGNGSIGCCYATFYIQYTVIPPVEEWEEKYPDLYRELQWNTLEYLLTILQWYDPYELMAYYGILPTLIVFGADNKVLYHDKFDATAYIRSPRVYVSGYYYRPTGLFCTDNGYLLWMGLNDKLYIAGWGTLLVDGSTTQYVRQTGSAPVAGNGYVPLLVLWDSGTELLTLYCWDKKVHEFKYHVLTLALQQHPDNWYETGTYTTGGVTTYTWTSTPIPFVAAVVPLYNGNLQGLMMKLGGKLIWAANYENIKHLAQDDTGNHWGFVVYYDVDTHTPNGGNPNWEYPKTRVYLTQCPGTYNCPTDAVWQTVPFPAQTITTRRDYIPAILTAHDPISSPLALGQFVCKPETLTYKLVTLDDAESAEISFACNWEKTVENYVYNTPVANNTDLWSPSGAHIITRDLAFEINRKEAQLAAFCSFSSSWSWRSTLQLNAGACYIYYYEQIAWVLAHPSCGASTAGASNYVRAYKYNRSGNQETTDGTGGNGSTVELAFSTQTSCGSTADYFPPPSPWCTVGTALHIWREEGVYILLPGLGGTAQGCYGYTADVMGADGNYYWQHCCNTGVYPPTSTTCDGYNGYVYWYNPYFNCYRFYARSPLGEYNEVYGKAIPIDQLPPNAIAAGWQTQRCCGSHALDTVPRGKEITFFNKDADGKFNANAGYGSPTYPFYDVYYKGKLFTELAAAPVEAVYCCGSFAAWQDKDIDEETGRRLYRIWCFLGDEPKSIATFSTTVYMRNCCSSLLLADTGVMNGRVRYMFFNVSGMFAEISVPSGSTSIGGNYQVLCCNNRSIAATPHVSFVVDETFGIVPIDMYDLRILDETDKNDLEDEDDNRILPLE